MDYKFQRTRIDKISRDKIIEQLEKAAKCFNYIESEFKLSSNPLGVAKYLAESSLVGKIKQQEIISKKCQ